MTDTHSAALLKKLAIAAISIAKSHYPDDAFQRLDIVQLQKTQRLISECVPTPYSADPVLLHHTVDSLINGQSVEETVMHVFLLYIYRLVSEGSNHPLERGIVRQQIVGILPIFESALNQGLISPRIYDPNADALLHIADNDSEVAALIDALSKEYKRLAG